MLAVSHQLFKASSREADESALQSNKDVGLVSLKEQQRFRGLVFRSVQPQNISLQQLQESTVSQQDQILARPQFSGILTTDLKRYRCSFDDYKFKPDDVDLPIRSRIKLLKLNNDCV